MPDNHKAAERAMQVWASAETDLGLTRVISEEYAPLVEAAQRQEQGYVNLLDLRRCVDGRYYLTKEEIEGELATLRAALEKCV